MHFKSTLDEIGLTADNSVVIGSGILNALGIRRSNDIDMVVSDEVYGLLRRSGRFTVKESYGREILADELFEIGRSWGVLGSDQSLPDLYKESIVIDEVRYLTPEFLLLVKKSWLKDPEVRKKDADDVRLIEAYLAQRPRESAV